MREIEVQPAEPKIKPNTKPEREVKPRPNENDPWTVPKKYPEHWPQPTPKALDIECA